MNDGLAVLVALMLLSAMLCAILLIAWRMLDRTPHALTWATAFGLATLQWVVNILYFVTNGSLLMFVLVNTLAVVVAALLGIGFRQRARMTPQITGMAIGGLATILIVLLATFFIPHVGVGKSAPLLFRAIVLAMAAAVVVPQGRAGNPAERAMVAMLWLFVLFNIAVAAVALAPGMAGSRFSTLDRWMLLLGLPAMFAGTGLFAIFLIAADLAERMRTLAARDPLTGALNRRGFEEAAARVIANAVRHGQPLSLALADLDRFKLVNDLHGHAAGDALLRQFADDVSAAIRQGDLFGRLGGEEFVLLLPSTPGAAAVAVIDRLRREVATYTLSTDPPMVVTTSFGVAELAPGDRSIDSLIARADRALYQSKQAGRNRVSFAAPEELAAAAA